MRNRILWFLFILLVGSGVIFRFSTSHEKMPIGCDEFGYLNQSKAIDMKRTFENHTERPYLSGLLDTLRKSGISENEIAWMITPHAYHLLPGTNKIINQYPPGTSLVLALIPISVRKIIFPFLAIIILIIFPLIAVAKTSGAGASWFHPVFAGLIFIITISAPFLTELTRVNSLAFTFGLLLASGILFRRFPFWSVFLIALTVNFRMANLVLLFPAFIFILLHEGKLISLKKMLVASGVVLLALTPLFIYNYLLIGNPISSTYSSIDKSFSFPGNVADMAAYYFSWSQYWFRIHVITILILFVLAAAGKFNYRFMLAGVFIPIVNYVFFICHDIKMDYYPYASAIIVIGIILGAVSEFAVPLNYRKPVLLFIAIIGIFIFGSGISRYMRRTHLDFDAAKNQYAGLCKFDIVWADLYSGTSEYVCNNNGFRFGTTTPRARKMAMVYLNKHNYTQAILLDDNTVDQEIIFMEVNAAGLQYTSGNDEITGKYISIE